MNFEQLLQIKAEYTNKLSEIDSLISAYKDGFEYAVCIHSYGSHNKIIFNNLHAAVETANEYYEDNGFAHLYTNNKDIPSDLRLSGGSIFLVDSVKEIEAWSHPTNAVEIRQSANQCFYYEQENDREFVGDLD